MYSAPTLPPRHPGASRLARHRSRHAKVKGIVLADTTHVWPLKSVFAGGLLRRLRWDEASTPASISVPTLVITGDADRITLPKAAG